MKNIKCFILIALLAVINSQTFAQSQDDPYITTVPVHPEVSIWYVIASSIAGPFSTVGVAGTSTYGVAYGTLSIVGFSAAIAIYSLIEHLLDRERKEVKNEALAYLADNEQAPGPYLQEVIDEVRRDQKHDVLTNQDIAVLSFFLIEQQQ